MAVYSGESSLGLVCISESGDVMFWPQFTSDQHCLVQGEIDIARKDSVKCVCVVPVSGLLVVSALLLPWNHLSYVGWISSWYNPLQSLHVNSQ